MLRAAGRISVSNSAFLITGIEACESSSRCHSSKSGSAARVVVGKTMALCCTSPPSSSSSLSADNTGICDTRTGSTTKSVCDSALPPPLTKCTASIPPGAAAAPDIFAFTYSWQPARCGHSQHACPCSLQILQGAIGAGFPRPPPPPPPLLPRPPLLPLPPSGLPSPWFPRLLSLLAFCCALGLPPRPLPVVTKTDASALGCSGVSPTFFSEKARL